jgi:hypothetical protein
MLTVSMTGSWSQTDIEPIPIDEMGSRNDAKACLFLVILPEFLFDGFAGFISRRKGCG